MVAAPHVLQLQRGFRAARQQAAMVLRNIASDENLSYLG
jgi:hypothetical protein